MDLIVSSFKGVFETLLKAPTVLLFVLALNVIGWVLKRSAFPNKFIPHTILLLATIGMPFILAKQPCGEMDPYLSNPAVADMLRRLSIGLVLGLLAWGSHKAIIGRLSKVLPGLEGDTKIEKKTDIEKP